MFNELKAALPTRKWTSKGPQLATLSSLATDYGGTLTPTKENNRII